MREGKSVSLQPARGENMDGHPWEAFGPDVGMEDITSGNKLLARTHGASLTTGELGSTV